MWEVHEEIFILVWGVILLGGGVCLFEGGGGGSRNFEVKIKTA